MAAGSRKPIGDISKHYIHPEFFGKFPQNLVLHALLYSTCHTSMNAVSCSHTALTLVPEHKNISDGFDVDGIICGIIRRHLRAVVTCARGVWWCNLEGTGSIRGGWYLNQD